MKHFITNLATAGLLTVAAALSINAQPTATAAAHVNINSATAAQLCYLPGVGQATAAAIIAGRPYKAPAELMKVRGIKAARFAKMQAFVSVAGQTTAGGKIRVGGAK